MSCGTDQPAETFLNSILGRVAGESAFIKLGPKTAIRFLGSLDIEEKGKERVDQRAFASFICENQFQLLQSFFPKGRKEKLEKAKC